MRLVFLILAINLLFPALSLAECPTIDLRESPGFRERKQVYQSDIGWCFAFSNADIVSQKIGRAVSPIDIAVRYFDFMGIADFDPSMSAIEGGAPANLKKMAKANPSYCTEENYGIENKALSLPIYDVHRNFKLIGNGCAPEVVFGSNRLFKNLADIEEVMIAIRRQSQNKVAFLSDINKENCKDKVEASIDFEIKSHQAGWDDDEAHQKTKQYLIEVLQSGKMISAGIDSTLSIKHELSFFQRMRAHVLGDHAVTITGMVESNGQCYFQIRDSSIESVKACNDQKVDPRISCLGGQDYNLPENVLLKSIKTSTFVK